MRRVPIGPSTKRQGILLSHGVCHLRGISFWTKAQKSHNILGIVYTMDNYIDQKLENSHDEYVGDVW